MWILAHKIQLNFFVQIIVKLIKEEVRIVLFLASNFKYLYFVKINTFGMIFRLQ